MKVIFLDIDGVLNFAGCEVKFQGCPFVAEEKMELLKELVESTGAQIVLSSTWRDGWADLECGLNTWAARMFVALQNKMKEYGLDFVSHTPWIAYTSRGEEIDRWLQAWEGEPVESFVILDDLEGVYLRPHAGRLVKTSFAKGLLPRHVEMAKKILAESRQKEVLLVSI